MKNFKIEINVGDTVEVGRFRNVIAKNKDIAVDENGQPFIITNKEPKKLLPSMTPTASRST